MFPVARPAFLPRAGWTLLCKSTLHGGGKGEPTLFPAMGQGYWRSGVAHIFLDYTLSPSLLSSDSVYLLFYHLPLFYLTLFHTTIHHNKTCLHSLHKPPRFWVPSITSYSLGCARGDADPHADHEVRTQWSQEVGKHDWTFWSATMGAMRLPVSSNLRIHRRGDCALTPVCGPGFVRGCHSWDTMSNLVCCLGQGG